MEGHGEFELNINIEGTIEHLAPQASTIPPAKMGATIQSECHWYDDCVYRYDGMEVRGTGNSFLLRLHAAAGLTYKFKLKQILKGGSGSGTHFNIGIFHENSVGGVDGSEHLHGGDFALGKWTTAGKTTPSLDGASAGRLMSNTE